jgi:subtilisin family serine protease
MKNCLYVFVMFSLICGLFTGLWAEQIIPINTYSDSVIKFPGASMVRRDVNENSPHEWTIRNIPEFAFRGDTTELYWDDGSAEAYYLVQGFPGQHDRMAVRFGLPCSPPMKLIGGRFYSSYGNIVFQSFSVCPDAGGYPDVFHPISKVDSVYGGSPGWGSVGFRGALFDSSDIWAVIHWFPGHLVGIGADSSAPDSNSYWCNDPYLTWDQWTATDWMMRLYVAAADTHDVTTVAILDPPDRYHPGYTAHPTAIFGNCGLNAETFGITFDIIDSLGSTVYTSTNSITLTSCEVETVTFVPQWVGINEGTYTYRAYTSLIGDDDFTNDTISMQGLCTREIIITYCRDYTDLGMGMSNSVTNRKFLVRMTPPVSPSFYIQRAQIFLIEGDAPLEYVCVCPDDGTGLPDTTTILAIAYNISTSAMTWATADFGEVEVTQPGDLWVIAKWSDGPDEYHIGYEDGIPATGRSWNYHVNGGSGVLYCEGVPPYNREWYFRLIIAVPPGYLGQTDIAHHPAILSFNYNYSSLLAFSSEKHIIKQTGNKIGKKLSTIITESTPDEFIPVFLMLAKQINSGYFISRAEQMTKSERRQFVISECKLLALETQKDILTYLKNKESEGKVIDIVSSWSTNAIGLRVKPDVISELARRSDVYQIGYSQPLTLVDEDRVEESNYKTIEFIPDNGREITWGIAKINADDVWALGYTGSGIVVGHMDSGVKYDHPDLADHMWDGSGIGYPNHGYDFSHNDNDPMDTNGHGTATAGILAGDGTNGSNTGVAPDAQIMAIQIYPGNVSTWIRAVDFALENDADLLSCSVGWRDPDSLTKELCRNMSDVVYAAGIVWCCAAGNFSSHYPIPQDIIAPSCCPGPWYAPNGGNGAIIAVGASDSLDDIASWSAYGPTAWNKPPYNDYPYPPGLMKPDVAAPGVSCKTLTLGGGYNPGTSGTSIAQPHVAGTVALMLSKQPSLTPRQIDSLIQTAAIDIEIAGRDSLSGAGRIDALGAVNAISEGAKWAQLWVINQSTTTSNLLVTDITKAQNSPWIISASPSEFSVPVDDSQRVWVTVDTTGQGLTWEQYYYDTLLIWSNATNANPERVPVVLVMATVGIEEQKKTTQLPVANAFCNISPNPSRDKIDIRFSIGQSAERAELKIFNAAGRLVRQYDYSTIRLLDQITWDTKDDRGRKVPAGVYFVRLMTSGQTYTEKVILLK